ncbi:MAG: hypothetical protein GY926_13690 [bacterium]|nr:hypothetical protein [bacterium]MCP4966270.1 hypothetical protein [bacterium]
MDESTTNEFAEGFVPVVRADGDVSIREAGALAIVAGGNVSLNEAGTGALVVGGDVTMNQAGSGNMVAGGSVEMNDSAVGQMFTLEATVAESRIGLLVAPIANVENSEIVIGPQQAIALGVAAGSTLFLLGRLFRRR